MKHLTIAITLLASVSGAMQGANPGLRAAKAQWEQTAEHAELAKTRKAMRAMEAHLLKGEAIDMAEYDALSAKNLAASRELNVRVKSTANDGTYKYFHANLTEAGTLEEVLGDEWDKIDSLIVTGPVNVLDYDVMTVCSFLGRLRVANLEDTQNDNNSIPSYAFNNPDYLTKLDRVILPNDIEIIGVLAFADSEVREVNLPPALRAMGMYVFRNCKNYMIPTFPEKLTGISSGCFMGNRSTKSVEIPSTVKYIWAFVFQDTRLTEVKFNEGLENIGSGAFLESENIERLELPSTCTSIGSYAFAGMSGLKEVKLPENILEIPFECFAYDTSLESIEIPGKVYSVGQDAFYGCTALRDVTLKNGISIVRKNAFNGCPIETLVLPRSIIAIDSCSFANNSKLQRIYSENPVPPVGCSYWVNDADVNGTLEGTLPEGWQKPFEGCPKDIPVYVPVGSADKYRETWGWDYFTNFIETTDFPSSAIGEIAADSETDAPAEYYNLQGIRVNEPAPGNIYIRHQGNRSTKVRF